MSERIIGALVQFNFSTHPPIQGYVQYCPQAPGDSWIVVANQQKFYVQSFDFMEVLEAREDGDE